MSNPLDMCCKTTCDPKAVEEWIEKKDSTIAQQAARIKELEAAIIEHRSAVRAGSPDSTLYPADPALWGMIDGN